MTANLMETQLQTSRPRSAGASASEGPTVLILGGNPDAPNLGVAALGIAAVKGTLLACPGAKIVVQAVSTRPTVEVPVAGRVLAAEGSNIHYARSWKDRNGSRRLEVLTGLSRWLPGPGRRWLRKCNRVLEQWGRADVVMDVSGGDSFAELYGPRRFNQHKALKRLALRTGKPLVLLPQTYGPFQSPSVIAEVREILTRSALAATRDVTGVQELEKLFGAGVAQSVRTCPDMAFFLDPAPVPEVREPAVVRPGPGWTLIGLNLSALLWSGGEQFGLKADYRGLVRGIAEWAAGRRNTRLVLIPHVVALEAREGSPTNLEWLNQQSDTAACREAMEWLGSEFAGRVACLGGPYGAAQTKHLIGKCDFMIGARMHACIGAVSQCVPAATLAYSKKAAGVMGQAGVADTVIDLRECSLSDCIAQIDAVFVRREEVRARLEGCIPEIQKRIEAFFTRDVAEVLGRLAGAKRAGRGG